MSVRNGLERMFLLTGAMLAALAQSTWASAAEGTAGTLFETSFTTTKAYADPFVDVEVDAVFTNGSNQWRVPAFFAGDGIWKVRFAPPTAGQYRFRVEASDKTNADLNGRDQVLAVEPYAGPNTLLAQGFLRVASDGRHFEHADGTPFLWLGDTWWKCLSKRMSLDDFEELAADRKAKGFNVVQIVCGPYPDEVMMEARWENEGGMPYPTKDFSRVNPRYFEFADRRIEALVEAGIVPAIVGGWGRPQQGGQSTLQQVGLDGFKAALAASRRPLRRPSGRLDHRRRGQGRLRPVGGAGEVREGDRSVRSPDVLSRAGRSTNRDRR